jgi:hypothetical protein
MIAGAEVFGIWGAILAAPTIGLFQALVGVYRRLLAVVSKDACEGVSAGEALQTPFLSDVWPNNVVFTISFVLIGLGDTSRYVQPGWWHHRELVWLNILLNFFALGQTASTAFLKGTIPYSDVTTFCRHTRLLGADQQNAQIYPPIYPRWGIAFALVFGYTDSLEVLPISVPAHQQQYLNLRGAYCEERIVVVIWFCPPLYPSLGMSGTRDVANGASQVKLLHPPGFFIHYETGP